MSDGQTNRVWYLMICSTNHNEWSTAPVARLDIMSCGGAECTHARRSHTRTEFFDVYGSINNRRKATKQYQYHNQPMNNVIVWLERCGGNTDVGTAWPLLTNQICTWGLC
jgi:hypothetical protein